MQSCIALPPSIAAGPAAAALAAPAAGPTREQRLRQDASRHRYRLGNARPATQAGFWDMGFGDGDSSSSPEEANRWAHGETG